VQGEKGGLRGGAVSLFEISSRTDESTDKTVWRSLSFFGIMNWTTNMS